MSSRFIPNIKSSGRTVKAQTIDKARKDGYKLAILAGAIMLSDGVQGEGIEYGDEEELRLHDSEIKDWIERTNTLVGSIGDKVDDFRYLIRAVEEMTDFRLDFE